MTYCVYWIREQSHTDLMSQGYIGVSSNVEERFVSHGRMDNGTNAHLRHAIKKYGWENLVKSVLLYADKDYCLDIERKLRPAEKIGWNLVIGGGLPPIIFGSRPELRGRVPWNKGKVGLCSAETIEKMRQARLGKSPANKGVPMSQEQIELLRQKNLGNTYRRGKSMPESAKEQLRIKHKGKKFTDAHKAAISAGLKGTKRSPLLESHKALLRTIAKGKRWYNNGTNIVFCLEGHQPEGYVLGRKNINFVKEK